jgi:hypothetical protein
MTGASMTGASMTGGAGVQPDAVMDAVDQVMLRPWDWAAGHHCLGDVAEIVQRLGGPDLMARLRGRYASRRGAMRLVAGAGGLPELVARECKALGMLSGPAVPGAVATAFGEAGWCVVVCIEAGHWAGKTAAGYAVIAAELEGWSWRH